MARRTRRKLPGPILTLAKQLDRYRRTPRRKRGLPERYWRRATKLALRHGASRVCQALGLDFYHLKRRLESSTAGSAMDSTPSVPPQFVEVDLSQSWAGSGPAVELLDSGGRKLTVRLAGGAMAEVLAVAQALWGLAR